MCHMKPNYINSTAASSFVGYRHSDQADVSHIMVGRGFDPWKMWPVFTSRNNIFLEVKTDHIFQGLNLRPLAPPKCVIHPLGQNVYNRRSYWLLLTESGPREKISGVFSRSTFFLFSFFLFFLVENICIAL